MNRHVGLAAAVLEAFVASGCYATVGYEVPAPPPPEQEVVVAPPFFGAIWVPGEWQWERWHHRYAWHRGYWRHPRDEERHEHEHEHER